MAGFPVVDCAEREPAAAAPNEKPLERPAPPGFAGIWAANCASSGHYARLTSEGIYFEGGGHGRWRVDGERLHIEVVAPPQIAFESRYPELLAHDENGALTIVGPDELEVEAGGLKKRFRRCPG